MKKFTLSVLSLLLTIGVFASGERENLLFWDFNTLSGNPPAVYPDVALEQTEWTEIWPMNEREDGSISVRTLRSATTSGVDGTPCLRAMSWEPISTGGIKYWIFDPINAVGFTDIVFSSYIYSTTTAKNKGPHSFRLDYRLEEDGEWVAVGDFKVIDKGTMTNVYSWDLPAACNNCETLAIRLVSNDRSIDDGIGDATTDGFNGLDNTTISGIRDLTGIADNAADAGSFFKQTKGSLLFTNEVAADCTIYDLSGRIVFNKTVSAGQTLSLNQGVYIISITNNEVAASAKIIVK